MANEDSCSSDDSDDGPRLSADTMAALKQFYAERDSTEDGNQKMPQEDWQLSQFWYDEHTASMLAEEVLSAVGKSANIACLSCPTLYHRLRAIKPDTCCAKIFEYDRRFDKFGDDFVFYDYNKPHDLPTELREHFDIVIVDPPFLSEECLGKVSEAVKFLAKEKVVLCTGATMEATAERLLGVKRCSFVPSHSNNLANAFRCFTNYKTSLLDGS